MPNPVHGHEVLNLMVDSKTTFTKATLKSAILERFGTETRFFTCSAENMTADGLIAFLEHRGKFIPDADGFSTSPDKICAH